MVSNLPANARDEFAPWVGKILWRKKWQPIPVFLPGKSHGQRSLVEKVGCPWRSRAGHDLATKQPALLRQKRSVLTPGRTHESARCL